MKQEFQKGKSGQLTTVTDSGSAVVRNVVVNVGGARVSLRTDREESYLKGLAEMVNERINALKRSAPAASIQQIIALICIQYADDLEQLRSHFDSLQYEVLDSSERMLSMLDEDGKGVFGFHSAD